MFHASFIKFTVELLIRKSRNILLATSCKKFLHFSPFSLLLGWNVTNLSQSRPCPLQAKVPDLAFQRRKIEGKKLLKQEKVLKFLETVARVQVVFIFARLCDSYPPRTALLPHISSREERKNSRSFYGLRRNNCIWHVSDCGSVFKLDISKLKEKKVRDRGRKHATSEFRKFCLSLCI